MPTAGTSTHVSASSARMTAIDGAHASTVCSSVRSPLAERTRRTSRPMRSMRNMRKSIGSNPDAALLPLLVCMAALATWGEEGAERKSKTETVHSRKSKQFHPTVK